MEFEAYETWADCKRPWCKGKLIKCFDDRKYGYVWYICNKCKEVSRYNVDSRKTEIIENWEKTPRARECKKLLEEGNYKKSEPEK